MAFFAQVEPGNSNRVYCGTLYGLHVSDNGGLNWSFDMKAPFARFATATMAIDKKNVNNLYLGNSWYIKDPQMVQQKTPGEQPTGKRVIWTSKDKGKTWKEVNYELTNGYKQCYTITIDPINSNNIYLGAASGLYRSTDGGNTFGKISTPAGMGSCRGADITPDGKFMYAVFHSDSETGVPSQTSVYVAPVNATATWTLAAIAAPASSNGLYYASGVNTYYWKPLVDPRSTATSHKVIIGCMSSNANASQGLFEYTGTVSNNAVSGNWAMVFGNNNNFNYEIGWNNILPQVRQYTYTPVSWNTRKVLLASQQSLYYSDPALPNNTKDKYMVLSTQKAGQFGNYTTYSSRGFQSTVNYDGSGLGNYVVQGMADNRILESWDNGVSWTQESRPAGGQNADYVDIIPANNGQPSIVITACGGTYGGLGDDADASHWAKKLSNPASPSDVWVSLESGTSGLPGASSRTYGSAYNPQNPKEVILATQSGLYYTNDIYARINNTGGTFTQIGATVSYKAGNVWWDPTNSNVIYADGTSGFLKGVRSGNTWTFTTIVTNPGSSVYYWKDGGNDYIAYATNEGIMLKVNNNNPVQILNRATILATHSEPWFGAWANGNGMTITINGIAGFGKRIFCGSEVASGKHGYAMFEGIIHLDGSVTWKDWSGIYATHGYMEIARLMDGKIVRDGSKVFYYAATRGAGCWRRDIHFTNATTEIYTSDRQNDGVSVIPNPFNKQTNIRLSNAKGGKYGLSVYNNVGMKVKEISLDQIDGDLSILIDMSDFEPGNYYYNIQCSYDNYSGKLVLVK